MHLRRSSREVSGMVHGADEGLHHSKWVERRLLPSEVGFPHVRDSPMRRLELLYHTAVGAPTDQIRGDETRTPVHLRHLVSQHVAIVVVCGHTEATIRPADNLHGGRVGDQVRQLAATVVEKPRVEVLLLIVRVEDRFHRQPKALLPLEDGFLRHNVWGHLGLEAACEEVMGQVRHVVEGVVVCDYRILLIGQCALINDLCDALVRNEGRHNLAPPDLLETRTILATDGVALEEDGALVAKLHSINVDGVTADCNPIPATPHCAVWAPPGLAQPELFLLLRSGRDCGFLEYRSDSCTSRDSVVQDSVLRSITVDAAQVKKLPLAHIQVRLDPLFHDEIHTVGGHLLSFDENHRRRLDRRRWSRRHAPQPQRRAADERRQP
mmetsp:Transcript_53050/g.119040  ORF Transcript_53050/g.119040 Transcript_53050/m.119040 type:complete len:380 (+) Transcript_53050:628-1767(+)